MKIEDCELLLKIGEGNEGVVYHGRSPSGLNVAVKLEKPSNGKSLLQHETTVLLSLKECIGIPKVLGYGCIDGIKYLITDLFDKTLDSYIIDKSECSIDYIRNSLLKIANTIHKKGFIHRDIKPSNIMFDKDGNLYIIDFGLATRERCNILKTSSGSFVGTYNFLGPMGRAGYVSKLVDFESIELVCQYISNTYSLLNKKN